MSGTIICQINAVTKIFPGVKALDGVSFSVHEGEIHALVGENGAGKSTLMNILSGAFSQSSGEIKFCGNTVNFTTPKQAQDAGIAMIHQELSLAPSLSIGENIFQGRLPKNRAGLIDYKKLNADAQVLMNEVGLTSVNAEVLVRNINMSQQQQVEIAKALSQGAKMLVLDEPTSALTTNEAETLLSIMRELKSKGITMLYISHKLAEIFKISDCITVLRDGTYIDTVETKNTSINQVISMMVGRSYNKTDEMRTRFMTDYNGVETVLEVCNLNSGNKIHDVSFKLHAGEVLGLTGLVGAGRSEVLQAVFGADPCDSISVKFNGKECTIKSSQDAIKHGIGLIAEGRKQQGLFLKLSVGENMSLVNLWNLKNKLGLISTRKESRVIDDFINTLSVKTTGAAQKISNLSGGNQQKAIISRWLMNKPKVLFLDEPTQGIDVGVKKDIYDIIDKLASEGVSIIFVSSDMQEILSLCDRILVMYEGYISGELLHADATQDKIMALASNHTG
jgi:ABC-type sugar transport system ATPase subunit